MPPVNLQKYTYFGAIATLYDEIYDIEDRIVIGNHFKVEPLTMRSRVYNKIYDKLFNLIENKERLIGALRKENQWQIESLKQKEDIGIEQIREITINKGGYAGLILLYLTKMGAVEIGKKFMWDSGMLMLLIDDYYDKEEDEKEGIKTLFTMGVMDKNDLIDLGKKFSKKYSRYPPWLRIYPHFIEAISKKEVPVQPI